MKPTADLELERVYEPDDAALDEVIRILLPELAAGEPQEGQAA